MAQQEKIQDISQVDFAAALRDIIKHWWLILIVTVLAGMAGFVIVTECYQPEYTASTTFVVSSTGSAGGSVSNLSAASELAEVFSTVLNGSVLTKTVAQQLGVPSLDAVISSSVQADTNLLTMTVTADSPKTAFLISRGIIENYSLITSQIMENAAMDVLSAPKVPLSPSNPMDRGSLVKRVMVLAFLLCVFLIGLLSYLSDTIKSEKEARQKLSAPLLAVVYHELRYKTLQSFLKKRKSSLLVSENTTSFGFSETFKKIRTKLEYKIEPSEGRGNILMVTSTLGSEGKSTIAANIALSLAQKYPNVLLLDLDMRRPAVGKLFRTGVSPLAFLNAFSGDEKLEEAWIEDAGSGLKILCPQKAMTSSAEKVISLYLEPFLRRTAQKMDYIVIDTPPMSAAADAEDIANLCDGSVLVVKQDWAGAAGVNSAAGALRKCRGAFLGVILNDVVTDFKIRTGAYGYGYGYGNRYGRYGRYGKYGSYGNYSGYGRYQSFYSREGSEEKKD